MDGTVFANVTEIQERFMQERKMELQKEAHTLHDELMAATPTALVDPGPTATPAERDLFIKDKKRYNARKEVLAKGLQ